MAENANFLEKIFSIATISNFLSRRPLFFFLLDHVTCLCFSSSFRCMLMLFRPLRFFFAAKRLCRYLSLTTLEL